MPENKEAKQPNSNIAYSYRRFSSKKQERGDSLRRQIELAVDYAERHDLILNETSFVDLGVSAYVGDNLKEDAGLGMFLSALESGRIAKGSYLLVESLDRMSRQHVQTALRQFLHILSHGITIVTLMDERAYTEQSDTTDLIISITIMSRAHEESSTKSKRLKAAWKNKREQTIQAHNNGSSTTKHTAACPFWLSLSPCRTKWLVNEERVSFVKLLFEKTINGFGQTKLSAWLNSKLEDGSLTIRPPRSDYWRSSTIKYFLEDKRVLGHYTPMELYIENGIKKRRPCADVITDYFPSIIDEETYYLAQSARSTRKQKSAGKKGQAFSNLLQGIG